MLISPRIRRLSFISFWLWLVLIVYLMIRPSDGLPTINIPHFDKLVHFVLFSTLGFLYWAQQIPSKGKGYLKKPGFYLLLLFTLCIEFIQLFLDYRSFELLDIFTNAIALLFGVFGVKVILRWLF